MTDKIASNPDTIREIVEKILTKLYINGSIKEGQLSKKILQTMTYNFIRSNNIENFSYKEMAGAMLRYNFCYYLKPELAYKSKCFLVNTGEIKKLVEKYHQEELLKTNDGEDQNYLNAYYLEYIITVEQKQEYNSGFTDNNSLVYKKTFDDDMKFLTGHENDITIDKSIWWPQLINLTTDFRSKEAKLIFKIESLQAIEIVACKVFLITHLPIDDNDLNVLTTYKEEACTKFDIPYEKLSTINHPYSIFIFFDADFKSGLVTQYNFTLNKLLCSDESKLDEAIKEKKRHFLPDDIDRMFLDPLPSYYPSKEMEKLMKNNFARTNLSNDEKFLLAKINIFSRNGLTSSNYVEFWETFIEMEDCATTEQFSRIDKLGEKLIRQEEYYVLKIPNVSEQSPVITEGGEITVVSSNQMHKKMIGHVHQVRTNDIILDMNGHILDRNTLYDIHFLPNRVTIQLEREALNYVAVNKISQFFFPKTVPTHPIDFRGFTWINESVKTNPEQQSAIIHIVEKSSFPAPYILMGPPGTGKTTTIVETVCQILKRNEDAKILIAASSNYACDVLALRLLKYLPNETVFRMYASSKCRTLDLIHPQLVKISNLKYNCHYYPSMYNLSRYNVMLTTVTIAGRFAQAKINYSHYSYVFIDESGSTTEPSTLIPIAGVISSNGKIHGQIILAGDPKQLGPVVITEKAKGRLGISLLERLIDTGIYAKDPTTGKYNPRAITKLIRNFRSHPKILEFPNEKFYSGELLAEGSSEITHWAFDWKYLSNKSVPILFEHVEGCAKHDHNSPSLYNLLEVRRVLHYIGKILSAKRIFKAEINQSSIGVITPYKKQCQKIAERCLKRNLRWIDIGSVEKFQGQEKPVIILSTVRSMTSSVGFLNNPKRLNVALTRAQALLIVVGNIKTLQCDPTWRQFIDFCKTNNVIRNYEDKKPLQTSETSDKIEIYERHSRRKYKPNQSETTISIDVSKKIDSNSKSSHVIHDSNTSEISEDLLNIERKLSILVQELQKEVQSL